MNQTLNQKVAFRQGIFSDYGVKRVDWKSRARRLISTGLAHIIEETHWRQAVLDVHADFPRRSRNCLSQEGPAFLVEERKKRRAPTGPYLRPPKSHGPKITVRYVFLFETFPCL